MNKIKEKFTVDTIEKYSGNMSLFFTVLCAIWLSVFGESELLWITYMIASVSGVINNHVHENKKMVLVFIVFCITNTIALIRLLFT